ncbi:hypothetical protein PHJA_001716100 [Phtheirospermum japonicum]|uniref:Uncharacterized protein n=1 Tax=Phtheirospermum japonicum TaxID=374723 RepID=A0A830C8X4_9LAMI|nr:hypothetical protein PHJA_001716100 [Phtheirospermum japonicum]
MAVSLLELLMGPKSLGRIRSDLFKRQSDYSMVVQEIGMKLNFIWVPYVGNLTELISLFKRNKDFPDVMVMGVGLWDMLHVNNASEYGSSLSVLRDNIFALLPVSSNLDHDSHLFWVGMPTLITSLLNTDAKMEKMTGLMCDLYGDELKRSRVLHRSGGPILNLDICLLSGLCGTRCTSDGMHYDGVVYDAAVQIMLNALLIESDQKPQRR